MKILCAGGGTLGSVTPLLAVINELRRSPEPVEVYWFGTNSGPERKLVESYKINFMALSAGKMRRYWSVQNFSDICRTMVGFFEALVWIVNNNVDVVLTAGSFVAVPVGWAAWLWNVPVLVHQQDVRPGLANKLLTPIATRITVSLKESLSNFPASKAVLVGNPVRDIFTRVNKTQARNNLGLEQNMLTLAVLGGGTGAEFFNRLMVSALPKFVNQIQIVHLTGMGKKSEYNAVPHYHVLDFTIDTSNILAAADLVVTRAGMGVLTELAALSKAALVVPIPYTHQEDNARLLEKKGAAKILNQSGLTVDSFVATVSQLLAEVSVRTELGKNLHNLFPPQPAISFVKEIYKLIKKS
jgi:UDP-N-acetylglucosamine--N-acetylmuramyl-(pentapeptide) pyrophosphoryl-undecaprenol N-acetylglucosamine transferase